MLDRLTSTVDSRVIQAKIEDNAMTQTVIAAAIVALATAWLTRRVYWTIASALGGNVDKIGSCGSCSRNRCKTAASVVPLGISPPKSTAGRGA